LRRQAAAEMHSTNIPDSNTCEVGSLNCCSALRPFLFGPIRIEADAA